MQVHVHDRLSRDFAHIDSYVVTRRSKFFIQVTFRLVKQQQKCGLLCIGSMEVIGNMALRDNQEMARIDRKFVGFAYASSFSSRIPSGSQNGQSGESSIKIASISC